MVLCNANLYLLKMLLDSNLQLCFCAFDSEDGKLRCGHSSFRGKRATMEDFYDIKTSDVDGQAVCMFGIFDG